MSSDTAFGSKASVAYVFRARGYDRYMGAREDRVGLGLLAGLGVRDQPASTAAEAWSTGAALRAWAHGAFVFKRREQRFADVI